MKQIAKATLSTSANSVTFSSIPGTYKDLQIYISARGSDTGTTFGDILRIRLNGNSSSSYSWNYFYSGNGAVDDSYNFNDTEIDWHYAIPTNGTTSGVFSTTDIYLTNYASTTRKKVLNGSSAFANTTGIYCIYSADGMWNNTSAVTSITFYQGSSGNFQAGSTFSLFGIG